MWLHKQHPLSPYPERGHSSALPTAPQQPHGKEGQEKGTGPQQSGIDKEVRQASEHTEEAQEEMTERGSVLSGQAQGHLMYAAIALTLLICLGAAQSRDAVIAVIGGVVGGLLILVATEMGKGHGS